MKTLPQRLLARIEMVNADERYLLIMTLNFPASGFQSHHGATQPTRLVRRMMLGLGSCYLMPGYLLSAYSGLFSFFIIHWFRTPGMNWGFCLFVCAGGVCGFVGFLFLQFLSLGFSVSPTTGLFYIKRDFSTTLNLCTLNLLTQYSWTKEVILNIFHLFLLQRENEIAIKYLFQIPAI